MYIHVYTCTHVQHCTLIVKGLCFQLWKNMLSLQVPQERKVAEAWNECIKRVIKRRVDKVAMDIS